jgi:predicted ATPase
MASALNTESVEAVDELAKPPFLRRVRIRGYKSIAFCDVTLEPLTILVGRNASGKSNFLDALAFLRDLFEEGANSALEKHGGPPVFWDETKPGRLGFEVESTFPSYRMQCGATYRVELALSARKQLEVQEEVLQLEDRTNGHSCGFTAARGRVTWHGLESFGEGWLRRGPTKEDAADGGTPSYPSLFDGFRPDRPLLGVIGSQPFVDLAEGLRSIGCFTFKPESIRKPQPRVGSPFLKRDGRNLARAIEGLKEIEERDVDRVKAYLRAIVPEIEGFEVFPLGDFETIRFQVCSRLERAPLNLYAASMSDGTLRALAALIAAFQIPLPTGPSVVGIEEPETALHPAAMRALVAALDEATLRTQILLTTHSPDLLDAEAVRPKNVRVVQMIDGQTVIGPVDEASVEIVRRDLSTLGGMERDNQLEIDLDDLERQQQLGQVHQESPA